MRYYFAPLEGITGYVYRTVHHRHFPGVDRYYMPFVAPNYTMHFKEKEKQDVDPAHNEGLNAVPQIQADKKSDLVPIEGAPPSLANLDDRCAFLPRCAMKCDRCASASCPSLKMYGSEGHMVACHLFDEEVAK